MLRNYYTLEHLAAEFNKLCGSVVIECFSQEKNTLIIDFYENKEQYLFFSSDSRNAAIYIMSEFNKARSNSVTLFPDLSGKILKDVKLIENERIIQFDFDEFYLFAQMFGGSRTNLCLTRKDYIFVDSFKNAKKLIGQKFEFGLQNELNFTEFPSNTSILEALSKCSLHLSKYYAEEICERLKLNPKIELSSFSITEFNNIESESQQLINEIRNSKTFYILQNDNGNYLLSLKPLNNYPVIAYQFESISSACRKIAIIKLKENNFTPKYVSIKNKLEHELNRIQKKLKLIEEHSNDESRNLQYHLFGELLLYHSEANFKKGNLIEIEDWEGKIQKIPLNSALTLKENATNYFDKAKKSKEEKKNRLELIPLYEKRLNKLQSLIIELENIKGMKELSRLVTQNNALLGSNEESAENQEPSSKFKVFDLGEGYILYVGKNAANNDELTLKFAKPNDLWFHARGSSGSHAVLRGGNPKNKLPKYILEKAASITAYYSGARKAKYVPVCYTQKKYVRKPKGSDVGAVVVSREEVVMVEPGL